MTSIPFNTTWHRTRLMRDSNYLANPAFDDTVAWKTLKHGDILVDKHAVIAARNSSEPLREDAVLVLVGSVELDRLFVSPMGNFSPKFGMHFEKIKFQLSIGRPSDLDFGSDFDEAVKKLEKLQASWHCTNKQPTISHRQQHQCQIFFTYVRNTASLTDSPRFSVEYSADRDDGYDADNEDNDTADVSCFSGQYTDAERDDEAI
ncbi:hypothetical protein F5887DRAFT_1079045 [Amanita rubescens]|nr:hypothetical protein F5887DRAFT_1079045 [Amanita rubescens]